MKYLILLLLVITSCTDKTPKYSPEEFARSLVMKKNSPEPIIAEALEPEPVTQEVIEPEPIKPISDAEKQKLIQGIENGDYSVLDPYLSREKLYPYKIMQATQVSDYQWVPHEDRESISKNITFDNNGKVIAYTNQYGFVLLNDEEFLLTKQDISNIPNAECLGFEYIINTVSKLTNNNDIINELNESMFDSDVAITIFHSIRNFEKHFDDSVDLSIIDEPEVIQYIYQKLYNDNQQPESKNALLNYLVFYMFLNYPDHLNIPMHIEVHYAPGETFCAYTRKS